MIPSNPETGNETVTVWICPCCGQVAIARMQPVFVGGREPITQIECHDISCVNYMNTQSYRSTDPEAVEQTLRHYTPVTMDAGQVSRFIEAVDFTAKAS